MPYGSSDEIQGLTEENKGLKSQLKAKDVEIERLKRIIDRLLREEPAIDPDAFMHIRHGPAHGGDW